MVEYILDLQRRYGIHSMTLMDTDMACTATDSMITSGDLLLSRVWRGVKTLTTMMETDSHLSQVTISLQIAVVHRLSSD